jgi:hypothetical protein
LDPFTVFALVLALQPVGIPPVAITGQLLGTINGNRIAFLD